MKQREILVSIIVGLFLILSSKAFPSSNAPEQYRIGFRDKIFALHVSDEKSYWVVGDMGLILNTTDGGETWVKVEPVPGDASPFNDITFVQQSGWIVGERGLIFHTEDGGNHWVKQVSNSEVPLEQLFFLDKQRGVIVGDEGTVLWTEDGGSGWQAFSLEWSQVLPESLLERGVYAPNLYDVFFVDETHGWIAGDAGIVLFSADAGKSWSLLRVGLFPPLYSLYFKDELRGWAVGQGGSIIHTEDGGRTWNEQSSPVKVSLFKIKFLSDGGIVVGDLGTILQTKDGGKSWDRVEVALRPPLPWFLDVGPASHNSPNEVICVGEGIVKKYTLNK